MASPLPFQLDKKELTKDVPMIVKPIAGAIIDWFNRLDANHDGRADVGQAAPLLIKAMPFIHALLPLIDWSKLLNALVSKFAKDPKAASEVVAKLLAVGEEVIDVVEAK